MAIYKNNRLIGSVYHNNRPIKSIFKGYRQIWSNVKKSVKKILSCFFNGYWMDEYPWTDNTSWKD